MKLQKWGYRDLTIFESMVDAGPTIEQRAYDIVISNLRLLDGWIGHDFARSLTQHKTHLIILTGLGNLDLHQWDWEPIVPTFLFKPYTLLQLKNELTKVEIP